MSAFRIVFRQPSNVPAFGSNFAGGQPLLPRETPRPYCSVCGAQQTFFFQVALPFPPPHLFSGLSLAFFLCTACDGNWPKAIYSKFFFDELTPGYLEHYQTNFRVVVFRSSDQLEELHGDRNFLLRSQIDFETMGSRDKAVGTSKVGGKPGWYKVNPGDEDIYQTATYMDGGFEFLMQLRRDFGFPVAEDAPPQAPWDRAIPYTIFDGATIFFLATTGATVSPPQILLIAQ
jgi:hypothetical protein